MNKHKTMNQRRTTNNENDRFGTATAPTTNNPVDNSRGSLSKHKKRGKWSLDITFFITVIIVMITFGFFIAYSEQTINNDLTEEEKKKTKEGVMLFSSQQTKPSGPAVVIQKESKSNPIQETEEEDGNDPSPTIPTGTESFTDSTKCHDLLHDHLEDRSNTGNNLCRRYNPLIDLNTPYNNQSFQKKQPHIPNLLRGISQQQQQQSNNKMEEDVQQMISSDATVLTRQGVGLSHDVNQDRSFVISPYLVVVKSSPEEEEEEEKNKNDFVMGIFDGHGENGEYTSHYAAKYLPKVLASKLEEKLKDSTTTEEEEEDVIKQALIDSFHQVDAGLDREIAHRGGATATFTYRHSNKLYIANIGDSFTFVLTHNPTTQTTKIVYKTREDKPHLPEERARIESMGGMVSLPPPWFKDLDSSRVQKKEGTELGSGMIYALAMSRSFGDLEMKDIGVIATPVVDVLDVEDVKKGRVGIVDDGKINVEEKKDGDDNEEELQVFVVTATDGLLQGMKVEDVVHKIAVAATSSSDLDKNSKIELADNQADNDRNEKSLEKENKNEPLLLTCEELILQASENWRKLGARFPGTMEYRDDMSIAVMRVR